MWILRLVIVVLLVGPLGRADDASLGERLDGIAFYRNQALEELLADRTDNLPDLLTIAASEDPNLRNKAIYVIGESGRSSAQVKETLAAALRSSDLTTRYVAATALAKVAPEAPDYVPWLLLAVKHARPWPANNDAAAVLNSIDASIAPRFVSALGHPNAEVRLRAFIHLWHSDLEVLAPLAPLLRKNMAQSEFRGPFSILLARIFPNETELRGEVRSALSADESKYAAAAIRTLRRANAREKETVTALLGALECESAHVNSLAATLLGDWKAEPKRSVPALIRVVEGGPEAARRAAAYALARFPGWVEQTMPALIAALHEQYEVRERGGNKVRKGRAWAASVLGRLGAPDAVPGLVRALEYDGGGVWSSAVEALGDIGPPAGTAVPALIAVLENEPSIEGSFARFREYMDGEVRRRTIVALGKIGPAARAAIPILEELSGAGNEDAAKAIQKIRSR